MALTGRPVSGWRMRILGNWGILGNGCDVDGGPKNSQKKIPTSARRAVLVAAGFGFVGLAVAGAVLPVLPSTPFLLLASWCFVRSDPRWNDWLLRSRWFGPVLRDWQEKRGVRRSVKTGTLVMMPLVLTLSIVLGGLSMGPAAAVVGLGLIGFTVVARLPVVTVDTRQHQNDSPR